LAEGAEITVVAARASGTQIAARHAVRALEESVGGRALVVARGGDALVAAWDAAIVPRPAAEVVRAALLALDRQGVVLHAGVSLPCQGVSAIPRGYAEAQDALARASEQLPIVALPELSTLDYLLLFSAGTAQRTVSEPIRALARPGDAMHATLAETVLTWAAYGLNVRRVAEELHAHPNTVYHRLRSVEELTGLDLHRFAHVAELIAALKLLRGEPWSGNEPAPARRPSL
jgi:sugar diacid utilization regulator